MSGRYIIKEEIGRGGLGSVFRAHDTRLDRDVALKRILVESGESIEELTANLMEEAKALSALKHPNIVTVHDVGHDEVGSYVVMELLEGETLEAIVQRGRLTLEDFEPLALQTLEGLVEAQSVDLVHRDLKPANIMIVWLPSGKFQVKILDFGLARFSRKPTCQTVDHGDSILGSIYFMAPEQFDRLPLDGRADLYSTGVIFYYALTGCYPFDGDSVIEVMSSHLQHRFTPLKQIRPEVPDSICDWVEKLMGLNVEGRPSSAKEALDEWDPKPIIDEEQFREAASNDPTIAAELLAGFLDEVGGLIEQLNSELQREQGAAAEETVRAIRGTASTLGYVGVISIAEEIEDAARSDPKRCRICSDRFPAALARLENAIGRVLWSR
jgi:serine/threonine protein kinase